MFCKALHFCFFFLFSHEGASQRRFVNKCNFFRVIYYFQIDFDFLCIFYYLLFEIRIAKNSGGFINSESLLTKKALIFFLFIFRRDLYQVYFISLSWQVTRGFRYIVERIQRTYLKPEILFVTVIQQSALVPC